jgi:hypothetical protein
MKPAIDLDDKIRDHPNRTNSNDNGLTHSHEPFERSEHSPAAVFPTDQPSPQ